MYRPISSLGVLSETSLSLIEMLKDLEFDEACRKYLVRRIINTCIRSTYYIFCKRNKVWDNPELMSYLIFYIERVNSSRH